MIIFKYYYPILIIENQNLACDILKSFEFLSKKRQDKPRDSGLTMVLDKGLGLETAESLMDISGEYVDYLKFGWGTSIVHEQDIIKSKVKMLGCSYPH